MTEIENKILGKTDKRKLSAEQKYLTSAIVWKVSKSGCGSSLFNGLMVSEMLGSEAKKKALQGCRKISENGFVFERLSKEKAK